MTVRLTKLSSLYNIAGGVCVILLVIGAIMFTQCAFDFASFVWRYCVASGVLAYQAFWVTAAVTSLFVIGGFALLGAAAWLTCRVFFLNKWSSA